MDTINFETSSLLKEAVENLHVAQREIALSDEVERLLNATKTEDEDDMQAARTIAESFQETRIVERVEVENKPQILNIYSEFMNDYVKVLSRGDISTLTGQAKSRKSAFCQIIVRYILSGENQGSNVLSTDFPAAKILWIDTEQSDDDCQRIYNNLTRDLNENTIKERLFFHSVSRYSRKQRLFSLYKAITDYTPDLVILDGIVDIIYDFNDIAESNKVVMMIKKWAVEFDCHILSVIHLNPTTGGQAKLRGHVGTFLMQKSQTVFQMALKEDKDTNASYSIVEPYLCRSLTFTEFPITHINGLPQIAQPTMKKKDIFSLFEEVQEMTMQQLIKKAEPVMKKTPKTIKKKIEELIENEQLFVNERNGIKYVTTINPTFKQDEEDLAF